MGLSDLFRRFYRKVYVGIYREKDITHVSVLYVGKGGPSSSKTRAFGGGFPNGEAVEFVREAVETTPLNYIAVLTDAAGCGAVATCSASKAKEMFPEVAGSRTVCMDEEWMNFLDEETLTGVLERYAVLRPDALYTPFALLHFLYREAMEGAHALYLLVTPEAMSLAVVKERHLRFAEHFRCDSGARVPAMAARIVEALENYYGKPCCRGEFIETVHIADGAGVGGLLRKTLDDLLLLDSHLQTVDMAELTAELCKKETDDAI